jgi:hypothetical protein
MPLRGQKPHPTSLRRLHGNPGKRAYNRLEPEPPLMAPGGTPEELAGNVVAIREWERLAPMLRAVRQITEADRSGLIALCLEWSAYLEGGTLRSFTCCLKLWQEFGLTPSSRTRVQRAETPAPGGDTFSEFDQDPPSVVQ